MKVVGLTGGIGSGKSTVARMFEELGIPVYYADDRAKLLMNSSPALKKEIVTLFGENAYDNGHLNRPFIAGIVFRNKDKLNKLNSLVHPEVKKDFAGWIKDQKGPYVIQENPLIFEKDQAEQFDLVLTVIAPTAVKLKRIMDRDHLTEAQVMERMDNQLDDEVKMKGSDFVIDNQTLENTKLQVKNIHQQLV